MLARPGVLQGKSLSFDPEVSGPKGRMNPAYETFYFKMQNQERNE
jgi:hypothetical protein